MVSRLSTDCELSAQTIYEYYTLRFQIESLFRDAKQFTGLNECQARDKKALHFHFNLALASVGVTKIEEFKQHRAPQPQVFSLASWKQRAFNEHLLDEVISKLALEPIVIKIIRIMSISELTVLSPPVLFEPLY